MNYYFDCSFNDGFRKSLIREKKYFIDLISIGIAAEDGREYYAISKDFNLKVAWNTHGIKGGEKIYSLRERILKPIYNELASKHILGGSQTIRDTRLLEFDYPSLKFLLKKYGRTSKEIAEDIMLFVWKDTWKKWVGPRNEFFQRGRKYGWYEDTPIEFYSYNPIHDWMLLCSVFGGEDSLPYDFHRYNCSRDLKQILYDLVTARRNNAAITSPDINVASFDSYLLALRHHPDYPNKADTQAEHSMVEARWNKRLHEFLLKEREVLDGEISKRRGNVGDINRYNEISRLAEINTLAEYSDALRDERDSLVKLLLEREIIELDACKAFHFIGPDAARNKRVYMNTHDKI